LTAHAEVATLGKGWLLDSAGSITSAAGEVISGRNSIKGSYTGADSGHVQFFLNTVPAFIPFTPNQTYTITLNYRIIAAAANGFGFGFTSSTANAQGVFLPSSPIRGATGATGTATLTANIGPYSDVRATFSVGSPGAIVVDDIQITDALGHLVTSENAEGPTIVGGPLGFQLVGSMALSTPSSNVRSAAVRDLDGDGYPELILTLTDQNAPRTTPLSPIVVEASGSIKIATSTFFPGGAPTVKHSPVTLFVDINNDGLEDILFADAGSDGGPTQTGSRIGVALNLGGGKFQDVSSLIPADQQTTRSYSLAAGDIDNSGRVAIIVPDDEFGTNTALLRWNGNGFDEQRNWIASSLWTDPTHLGQNDWMSLADFDRDGRVDLLIGGAPVPGIPNWRLLFGGPDGFTSKGLIPLPDGLFGHALTNQGPAVQTSDIGPVVIADFNNDGLPDIFAAEEQSVAYQPGVYTDSNDPYWQSIYANGGIVFQDVGFQVLINEGSRQFIDITSESTTENLGRRHYFGLIPIDLNNDGFMDVVGLYTTKAYGKVLGMQYGTTLFLNDGTGAFQIVEGTQVLAAITTTPGDGQQWDLGSFVPTIVNRHRTEGVVFESVGGCGIGFCNATGLNLYKIVANAAIGTGPNFADSASLGVPGFNEFYYLRTHADAATAVKAGQYATGLAHYEAVGKSKGYDIFAPNATIVGTDQVDTLTLNGKQGDFRIARTGDGFTLTDTTGHYGTLRLVSIERVQFSDALLSLNPAASVEYYNAAQDHYFMTWVPSEIAILDAGVTIKGWSRTGYSFDTYSSPATGTSPVCRFYIPPQLGDSHFYGRGTEECNATGQKNPTFVLEDPDFMNMFLPVAGVCPANTTEVYRVFDNRPDANHRYMTDKSLRDQMVAKGWIAEGDGPDLVVMCAPQ
jgi:hypothetical protein